MVETYLVEHDDRWELNDDDRDVWSLTINNEVSLQLNDDIVIRIGGYARLIRDEYEEEIDVDAAGVVVALSRLWQKVERLTAFKDGRLEMQFGDTGLLDVPADDHYEPWMLEASNGVRIVSVPGGTLAVWRAGESVSIDGHSSVYTSSNPAPPRG